MKNEDLKGKRILVHQEGTFYVDSGDVLEVAPSGDYVRVRWDQAGEGARTGLAGANWIRVGAILEVLGGGGMVKVPDLSDELIADSPIARTKTQGKN